jgi:hypothetical protein
MHADFIKEDMKMKKTGNSDPETCFNNLLSMTESECPLDRMRGMSTGLVDAPVDIETIEDDIAETIGTYEQRIKINNIDFEMDDEGNAEFSIDIEESDYVEDDSMDTEEAQEMALEDSADIPTTQS